jgi:Protein of unknown function (DUF642)/PEP-CTERM motif
MDVTIKRFCSIAMLICMLALPSLGSNLISNGSFETPTVPVEGFMNFLTGSTFPGWTVVGTANRDVSIVSGSYVSNGATFPAQSGVQWLDLTGYLSNTSGEGVEQTISTVPLQAYQLTYWVGNVTAPGYGTSSTVNISIDGVPTFSDTNSMASPTLQVWEQFTHTFVATGSSTVLDFLNGDPSNDNTNGIDNLSVMPVMSTVPEPNTLFLFISGGLAGLAALRRRV